MWLSQAWLITEVATCSLIGVLGLLLLAYCFRVRSRELPYMEAFLAGFLIRIVLVFINEQYLFFEHKLSGERSVDFFLKLLAGDLRFADLLRDPFALQVLANTPFFSIFGADLMTLLITNSMFSSLAGPLASIWLYRTFGESIARRAILIYFCHPAAINFSMFGLRDPLIYFFMTVFVVASMSMFAGVARRANLVAGCASCLCVLTLRPELIFVVVALIGMLTLPTIVGIINSDQRFVEKLAVGGGLLVAAGSICLVLGLVSLKIAAMQIGSTSINPMDFAGARAEERFARAEAVGEGGGTHIVTAETYANMPLHIRVPLQTIGLIVLPLPWLITGLTQMLAFADSLFLMALMALAFRVSWSGRRANQLVWAALIAFCVGILGMGLIISNAGNGFRMRFGIVPLLLLGSAFSRLIPVLRLRADNSTDT